MDDFMVLGAQIRRRRLALKLTQEALAHLASISTQRDISDLERGKGNPTLQTLSDLAFALNASIADLFSLEGVPEKYIIAARRTKETVPPESLG